MEKWSTSIQHTQTLPIKTINQSLKTEHTTHTHKQASKLNKK